MAVGLAQVIRASFCFLAFQFQVRYRTLLSDNWYDIVPKASENLRNPET